ncbi:MAG: hypothetical protein H0V51_20990, partial [Chloroflexi bacterium]|nr:hypothetical protein [Chloroflexota bacterium]
NRRVFPEAKLSTTIFATRAQSTGQSFTVRTHAGRFIERSSPTLKVAPAKVLVFDPENGVIPSCTQEDWNLAIRLLTSTETVRMGECVKSFQGEVNETNERAKGTLQISGPGPLILRGANISLYAARDASQGSSLYLDTHRFLQDKRGDSKAFAFRSRRVGFQRSAPQNNFRRIIAAPIPTGSFCFDTVSYVIEESSQIDLDLLLAFLNSSILDWYFRLGSTNSKVNEYQFNALPIPRLVAEGPSADWRPLIEEARWAEMADQLRAACSKPGVMPKSVADAVAEMSRRIQEIEARRVLKNRSERSRLASESRPIQDAIDAVLFRCFGLSDDEARYVTQRLSEML